MPTKPKSARTAPKTEPRPKKEKRVILFPTEPSVIGREKIEAAVKAAIAKRLDRQ
jgi:hypothetical protein